MALSFNHAAGAVALVLSFACVPAHAAQVTILKPAQEDTVHDNAGNLPVDVKVEPAIRSGEKIRILLDGKPVAPDSTAMSLMVRGVDRGEHWLQALLVDPQGQTLAVSDTVNFVMWQASINSPARKGKGNKSLQPARFVITGRRR
jgi:hypothetical protein